jgi:hypothetical protein
LTQDELPLAGVDESAKAKAHARAAGRRDRSKRSGEMKLAAINALPGLMLNIERPYPLHSLWKLLRVSAPAAGFTLRATRQAVHFLKGSYVIKEIYFKGFELTDKSATQAQIATGIKLTDAKLQHQRRAAIFQRPQEGTSNESEN